ncbi:hypothetical protein MASR2M117_07540 [Paludibacter sp.]
MIKKSFLAVFVSLILTLPVLAQGFATFTVEGSIVPASIKNVTNGNSIIEVLVFDNVDIKNVNYKYKLLGGCQLAKPLEKDFTNPQTVTVNKNDGSSKDWTVYVKRLTPASLPLELKFSNHNPSEWSNNVVGWAGLGVDTTKPTVIRFGNKDVSFWVAIKEPAKTLKYELKGVSKESVDFDGEFAVEVSADAKKWKTLTDFNSNNKLTADGQYEVGLTPEVRYIRWTYYERNKLNVNLNNIVVTAE